MPPSLSLHRITSLHDPFLMKWLDLYESAFPPEDRVPVSTHLEAVLVAEVGVPIHRSILAVLVPGEAGKDFAGMVQMTVFPEMRAALLGYFAIEPQRRNQGLGGAAFGKIISSLRRQGMKALVFDVEPPHRQKTPAETRLAERRIAFYERQGAHLLHDWVFYWQNNEHYIMVYPLVEMPTSDLVGYAKAVYGRWGIDMIQPGIETEPRPD